MKTHIDVCVRYLEVRYLEGWKPDGKNLKEAPMLDAAYSRQKLHVDHAAVRARRRLIIPWSPRSS